MKSTVQGHLDCKTHQAAVETMKKREKARVERRLEAEAEAEALPHKAAMRQPSLVCYFNGVWGGGNIGTVLLLAEGVTPLLVNHSRRVRHPYHALHVEPGLWSIH